MKFHHFRFGHVIAFIGGVRPEENALLIAIRIHENAKNGKSDRYEHVLHDDGLMFYIWFQLPPDITLE